MKRICSKCGKEFALGVDGYQDKCDLCAGVERISDMASETSAWLPEETYHLYGNSPETAIRVTREQARAWNKK